jgi:hypothetical protein
MSMTKSGVSDDSHGVVNAFLGEEARQSLGGQELLPQN